MHRTLEEVQMGSRKRINGDVKVYFSLACLLFVIFSGKVSVFALAFLIFSALSIDAAGKHYVRLMKIPTLFLVPSVLLIAFLIPGSAIDVPFPVKPTREGVKVATTTLLRAYASLSILSYLILTTTIPEFFSALKKLRIPDFFVEMAMLIYRTIQVLMEELDRLDRAADSRLGYVSKRAFVRTAALLGYSLFMKSLERAEKMSMAMESRCYSGNMPVRSERNSGYLISAIVFAALTFAWVVGV